MANVEIVRQHFPYRNGFAPLLKSKSRRQSDQSERQARHRRRGCSSARPARNSPPEARRLMLVWFQDARGSPEHRCDR